MPHSYKLYNESEDSCDYVMEVLSDEMASRRLNYSVVYLEKCGFILLIGGQDGDDNMHSTCEAFDPQDDEFFDTEGEDFELPRLSRGKEQMTALVVGDYVYVFMGLAEKAEESEKEGEPRRLFEYCLEVERLVVPDNIREISPQCELMRVRLDPTIE